MKTTKVGIFLAAIVLALIVSPAIPYSEAGESRNVAASIKNNFASSEIKTVMIVSGNDPQFVPKVIHLKIDDTIRFINQDGRDGGLAHQIISVDEKGVPDGKFNATFESVGDIYTKKFDVAGMYNYIDSTYPQTHGILVVS